MKPEIHSFAPGRVNLLGEHTDYNDGLVLPTTIPQRTELSLQLRADRRVTAKSANLDADNASPHAYELGHEARGCGWIDYVQGVTWVLAERGVALCGFDLRVRSQIPPGSGLSSSAALLTALLRGLRTTFSLSFSELELARLAQQVENQFVGAPVGILDPLACGLCEPDHALYIDTRTLKSESLPLPAALELVVIHSGVSHQLASTTEPGQADYRTRRAECERAAKLLGVKSLRELEDSADSLQRISKLPAPLDARVRHVLTENARVVQAADILRSGAQSESQLLALGALFAGSHRSQRDDYAVSVPEVDLLALLGGADDDIVPGAARLTGGGFGGSVVMLARRGRAHKAATRIAEQYARRTRRKATILVPLI